MIETPQLESLCYGAGNSSLYSTGDFLAAAPAKEVRRVQANAMQQAFQNQAAMAFNFPNADTPQTDTTMSNPTRRIVQVFIADPNENVPLENAILYQDEKPRLTDLTDQELFFEIELKPKLAQHNELRRTLRDKNASERAGKDVMLEPAKIRDLKMTVVTVAQF